MAFARLDHQGHILEVVYKPSIYMTLKVGERLVAYSPPAVDELTQLAVPVQPVGPNLSAVEFEIQMRPDAVALAKGRKNDAINAERLRANQSHFTFQGKQIAVDPLSRSDIDGAHGAWLLSGGPPPGWPGAWKAIDNTYVVIPDIATWGAFYGAMVAQGTSNFVHAQALKADLAEATTLEEVLAVPDW